MASKKELREELAAMRLEKRKIAELTAENEKLRRDNMAHADRESRRMRAEHEAEQHRLREKERAARKAHLADLGKGVLHLEGAAEHSISKDDRGVCRLDVTFTLDPEEYEAVEAQLRPAPPAPESPFADALNRIIGSQRLISAGIIPTRIMTGVV